MTRAAAIAFLSLSLTAGCASPQKSPPPLDPPTVAAAETPDPPPATQPAPVAAVPTPAVIDLGLYQMLVPYGSISGSKQFWKPINEQVLDVATHDLLDKNGVRVGEGDVSDWPSFKKILDKAGANTIQGHYLAFSATDQEIPAGGDLEEEHLFFFDHHGLSGQVYLDCRNLWIMSFGPSPALPHSVRIELSPVIRSVSRHYHAIVVNGQPTFDYSNDEQLFDLNLRADLPEGKFLVIAPSPQSERTLSLGHQFLTQDAKPGRKESVLIFVSNPRPTMREVK